MDLFEAITLRRSVRKYTNTKVQPEVIEKALQAALLAPNSSNLQTWKFFWIESPEMKNRIALDCMGQNAAKTASDLIVAVARPSHWKKTRNEILKQSVSPNAEKQFKTYYKKLIPLTYGWIIFSPLKWILFNTIGIFKPITRRPWSIRDIQEICIKTTALACENFMLAITAQGYGTCPMEGFDEKRIKKHLNLKWTDRVVMVIAVGEIDSKGIWGERFRCPNEWFIEKI